MMVSDRSKVFLIVGIALLAGCPSVQSASVTDLLNSILDTLKSIEGLMKYESSVVPQFLPKMLGDESKDSGDTKALLKKLQEKYLKNAGKSDQDLPGEQNARRSFKKTNDDEDDDDEEDDKPVEPINIQLPSRRELDAEKRKKKQNGSGSSEEDEDEEDEKSNEDKSLKKKKNYRTHSRDDSEEKEPDAITNARRSSSKKDSSSEDDDDASISEDKDAADVRRSFSPPAKPDETSAELEVDSDEQI